MKTTIKILGITEKKDKFNKTFFLYETDKGRMSCFKPEVYPELNKLIGNIIEVSTLTKGDFINIVGIYDIPAVGTESKIEFGAENREVEVHTGATVDNKYRDWDKFSGARASKDTMMKTSYAKDIFLVLLDKIKKPDADLVVIMQTAIDLVKQAEEGLK